MFCVFPEEGCLSGGQNIVNFIVQPAFNKKSYLSYALISSINMSLWGVSQCSNRGTAGSCVACMIIYSSLSMGTLMNAFLEKGEFVSFQRLSMQSEKCHNRKKYSISPEEDLHV